MGQIIDFTRYGNTEHDLALCHTNDMVDAINKTWNEHYAKTKDKQLNVNGFENTKYIIHVGLKLMAYKNNRQFHNSEDFVVKPFHEETMTLKNGTGNSEINVDLNLKC